MPQQPTEELTTDRLVLTPLRIDDATEMVGVLSSNAIYSFTGGNPPEIEELRGLYRSQVSGPPLGAELWHNWIIRLLDAGGAIGLVQATVIDNSADVAWIVAPAWQRRGYAQEAANAMCDWLRLHGTVTITAHIHPDHTASNRVAAAVGLHATDEVDPDGEIVWSSA